MGLNIEIQWLIWRMPIIDMQRCDPKNIENQYAVTWKRWPMSRMWKGWLKFRRQRYQPFLLEMSLLCHLREKKHYKVKTGGRECIHPVGERKCHKKRGEHFCFKIKSRVSRYFDNTAVKRVSAKKGAPENRLHYMWSRLKLPHFLRTPFLIT